VATPQAWDENAHEARVWCAMDCAHWPDHNGPAAVSIIEYSQVANQE